MRLVLNRGFGTICPDCITGLNRLDLLNQAILSLQNATGSVYQCCSDIETLWVVKTL
jgi:hypothetical protein